MRNNLQGFCSSHHHFCDTFSGKISEYLSYLHVYACADRFLHKFQHQVNEGNDGETGSSSGAHPHPFQDVKKNGKAGGEANEAYQRLATVGDFTRTRHTVCKL